MANDYWGLGDVLRLLFGLPLRFFNAANIPLAYDVGLLDILIGFMVIGFIVCFFWKGARN